MLKNIQFDANQPDGGSSDPSNANGQESLPEQQTDANNTNADEVNNAVDDFVANEQNGDETPSEEATGDENAEDQQNTPQEQVEEQPDPNIVLDKPEDKSLQFHKHPRFQEVIRQKNEAQKQYDEVKPIVEQQKALDSVMRQYNISPQEFQSWIQYGINLRTNPEAALAQLEPIYKELAKFAGKEVDADLQAEVAAGTLSPERATEISRARAQQKYGQARQQWSQQGQQQTGITVVQGTIGQWETAKLKSDPDFKAGTPLYQLVDKNLRAMPPATDANTAWQNCEKAYSDAKEFMKQFQPRITKPSRPAMQSRQSNNSNGTKAPANVDDAIKQFVAQSRRPSVLR